VAARTGSDGTSPGRSSGSRSKPMYFWVSARALGV
jgi:hypothetical protein